MAESQKYDQNQVLKPYEVAELLGISLSTLIRLEKSGAFIPRIQVSQRVHGWKYSELLTWIELKRSTGKRSKNPPNGRKQW